MNYVSFGRTGLRVSPYCLGTMTFGKEADESTSIALMNRALELGINFFDTANTYNGGLTEQIVGRWLKPHREAIVLASKCYFPTGPGPNERGTSRRNITLSVEKSLKRLDTEWLDILYLHHWDDEAAIEESLDAVDRLVTQGKVFHCGVSNFTAWQSMKAIGAAQALRLPPIVCMQPMYNLVKRQAEVELLPLARAESLAVCPYNPLAAGLLTGKYGRGESGRLRENDMYRERYRNEQYWQAAERFTEFARKNGYSPAALAAAWVNSHPAVTSTILGARNLDQFNDTMGALDIDMTPELRKEISALSADPPLATDR
ncbi:MAG: hypothetical protein QG656_498 [Candidatus Hydrogenedentes bacterium]|nr:hypothetical protein [Candidatus Hydrogenedentota bacterium]